MKTISIALLVVLYHSVARVHGGIATVSWFFSGKALESNTALTFNMGDTLNLYCKLTFSTNSGATESFFTFTKSSKAPAVTPSLNSGATLVLSVSTEQGTYVYSDIDGIQEGYENVIVVPSYFAGLYKSVNRKLNIQYLRTADSGTYHCTVGFFEVSSFVLSVPIASITSGSVNIVVNRKPGQAFSTNTKSSRFLTYSAVMLAAFKVFL